MESYLNNTSRPYFFSYCDTRPMSITFVAKRVKNASIMTAILLRVDTTKNMLTTRYNIYIIVLKRGTSVGSVCTFISARGFLNVTCPLDPGFDAMYLVTVQWRQNYNDYLYFSQPSHWDNTPLDLQQMQGWQRPKRLGGHRERWRKVA